jgi:hypothetical protein
MATARTTMSVDILQTKLIFARNFTDNGPISTQNLLFADGSGGTYWSSYTLENIPGFSSFYASTVGLIKNLGSFGFLSTGALDGRCGIGLVSTPALATLDVSGDVNFRSTVYMKGPVVINKPFGTPPLGNLDVSGSIVTSNLYCLGNGTFNGTLTAAAYLTSSDSNLKQHISTYVPPVGAWETLRGVSFSWKKDDSHDIGFIAQELAEVVPESVSVNEKGTLEIQPMKILPLLVETIKEMRSQIQDLKMRVVCLENKCKSCC